MLPLGDSRLTCPMPHGYMRQTPKMACKEAAWVCERLKDRFKIEFRAEDPKTDFLLGSNRVSINRESATLKATSYIELMVKRYLGSLEEMDDQDVNPSTDAIPRFLNWPNEHFQKDWAPKIHSAQKYYIYQQPLMLTCYKATVSI